MGILEVNDKIWKVLYGCINILTDRLSIVVIITGIVVGTVCVFARIKYNKRVVFGVTETVIAYSLRCAVVRSPVIHTRMKYALSFVADVLLDNENYMQAFKSYFQVEKISKTSTIAKLLYNATETQKLDLVKMYPSEIYKHLYETMHEILYCPFIGNLTISPIKNGLVSIFTCLIISIVVIFLILRDKDKPNAKLMVGMVSLSLVYGFIECSAIILFVIATVIVESFLEDILYEKNVYKIRENTHIKSDTLSTSNGKVISINSKKGRMKDYER